MRARIIIGVLACSVLSGFAQAESAWTMLESGIKKFRSGDIPEADRMLSAALRMEGKCLDAHYYLGLIAEQKRKLRTAAEHYGKIEEKFSTYPMAQERLGQMARDAGRLDDALKHYQVFADKRPGARAWMLVGAVQIEMKKYKEAEVNLAKAAERTKGNLDLVELQGRLYMETKRYGEALACYRTILEKIPSDSIVRFLVVQSLDKIGRTKEAKAELSVLLKRDPYNARALKMAIGYYADDPSQAAIVKEYKKRLQRLRTAPPRVRRVKGS